MKNNVHSIPYIHYVFGPGSDGESTVEQLKKAVENKSNGYLGSFELSEDMMECMRERSKKLPDSKTTNIMYDAFTAGKSDENDVEMVTIPRGRTPRVQIPRRWLYSCWAFSNTTNSML